MSEPPTPEQVTEWANHVGMAPYDVERRYTRLLREFAALAHAAGYEQGMRDMRERCAQICDQVAEGWTPHSTGWLGTDECRRRIRALDPAPEPEPRR